MMDSPVIFEHQRTLLGTDDSEFQVLLKKGKIKQADFDSQIESLVEWMKKVPHLAHLKIDKRNLQRVFSNVSFSVERAKEKIDSYYSVRSSWPEIFSARDPRNFMQAMDVVDWGIMPKKTPENYRISVLKLAISDPDLFHMSDLIQIVCMISDIRSCLETHSGEVYVMDCTNVSLSHILKMLPFIKNTVSVIQNSYSFKIKEMHLLNAPTFVYKAVDVFKSVVKDKIAKRVFFHKDFASLHKVIPRECLPKELNGKLPSCREITEMWRSAIISPEWTKWYLDSQNHKSDETKRPRDENQSAEFGLQGTFRSINLD